MEEFSESQLESIEIYTALIEKFRGYRSTESSGLRSQIRDNIAKLYLRYTNGIPSHIRSSFKRNNEIEIEYAQVTQLKPRVVRDPWDE